MGRLSSDATNVLVASVGPMSQVAVVVAMKTSVTLRQKRTGRSTVPRHQTQTGQAALEAGGEEEEVWAWKAMKRG